MVDITTIPLDELKSDLAESKLDITVCKRAIAAGITEYSGGSVEYRLRVNEGIVEMITAELERRNINDRA